MLIKYQKAEDENGGRKRVCFESAREGLIGEIAEAEAKGSKGALHITTRHSIIGLKFVSQSQ